MDKFLSVFNKNKEEKTNTVSPSVSPKYIEQRRDGEKSMHHKKQVSKKTQDQMDHLTQQLEQLGMTDYDQRQILTAVKVCQGDNSAAMDKLMNGEITGMLVEQYSKHYFTMGEDGLYY